MTEDRYVTLPEGAVLIDRPYSTLADWKRRKLVAPVCFVRGVRGMVALYSLEQLKAVRAEMERNPVSRKKRGVFKEETLAELEAQIAERMKPENRPSWWSAETEKLKRGCKD